MTTVRILDNGLAPDQLGEGIFWDGQTGAVFWVDIEGHVVHRYHVESATHQYWRTSKQVSFAYPQDGHLILCLADGIYRFDPESQVETPIAILDLPAEHRLNDAKLDPQGRLWVGTINTADDPGATAALYVLKGSVLEEIEGGYVNANGKAWSPDGKLMYHADTARGTIWEYDYDDEIASVSGKRALVEIPDGNPDGLSVDENGNIIAAMYGAGCLKIFSFRGDEIGQIDVPVPNPTSSVVVGSDLYITTAFDGLSDEECKRNPDAGKLFVSHYISPRA